MRITILQGPFMPVPPIYGGAVEKLWFALGKEFVKAGHNVIHISKKDKSLPLNEVIEGVSHIRINSFNAPKNPILSKTFDFIYSTRAHKILPNADILITNTFFLPFFCIEQSKGSVLASVERIPKGQLKFYKNSVHFRANSSYVKKAILAEVPSAISRTVLVPNPLPDLQDLKIFSKDKERIILYVGRIHPEKGIITLLKAFEEISEFWNHGFRLRIVGPSSFAHGGGGELYERGLQKRFAGLKQIEWVGPVFDDKNLAREYLKASIFVYPSIAEKGETFGLAPLESMAYGCVPIVSDLECFKDFITNRKNGLVFNHRQNAAHNLSLSLKHLMELNTNKLQIFQMEALKVRDSHSTAKIANQFLDYFQKRLDSV
jgi:glycosyltransferase involved in cell wall biosynthesis